MDEESYRSVITENERVTRRTIKARAAELGMTIQDYLAYAVEQEMSCAGVSAFNHTANGALKHQNEGAS